MGCLKVPAHRFNIIGAVCISPIMCLFISCSQDFKDKDSGMTIRAPHIKDSVILTDIGADVEITKFSGNDTIVLPMVHSTIGKIKVGNYKDTYLTILEPTGKIAIRTLSDSTLTTDRVADSLVNYLSESSLDFINKNLDFIFTTKNLDSVVRLFEAYKVRREANIEAFSSRLSASQTEMLQFYNEARLYGFLQFYGLVSKKLEARNDFYDFIEKIDGPDQRLKAFPSVFLNKLKIEYLRVQGTLDSLPDFLGHIDRNIADKNISDFLKFVFLKELIESSPYWEPEWELLDSRVLLNILHIEKDSDYHDLIQEYADKFLITQKGETAFDFTGELPDGTILRLGDLKGKVVFIDTWATWCAPCLIDRPKVIEMAKKFADHPEIEVLMVSVDDSRQKWITFLENHTEAATTNLFVGDGMNTEFGKRYNINSIPNYMLIDKQGKIVDAYIKQPSAKVEEMILRELSK